MTFSVAEIQTPESITTPAGRHALWLESLSHMDPSFGGITAVVPALVEALRTLTGTGARLAAFCTPGETVPPDMAADRSVSRWPASRLRWCTSQRLRQQFRDAVNECDGIHIHGLWEACSVITARAAQAQRKPYIVSAHGMLEPWALDQKAAKKMLYGTLFERPLLQGARCLHALTEAEAENYRSFGCTAPIAVIPNAVERPAYVDSDLFLDTFPDVRGKRILLFLGRLHHKKGVRLLLQSWAQVRAEFPETVLVLAGPDAQDDDTPQSMIRELDLQQSVVRTGMLAADLKWSALANATAFVLPSYSEGLSVATLEALTMGVPCVVTDACHLPEIRLSSAGWEVTPDKTELSRTLRKVLRLRGPELQTIGANAASLARQRFSWPIVSAQMAELYDWALTGRAPIGVSLQEVSA
jgi:glycosyltransferase involved in cell wall biosynthesis